MIIKKVNNNNIIKLHYIKNEGVAIQIVLKI